MIEDRATGGDGQVPAGRTPADVPGLPAGMSGEAGPLFRLIRDQRVAFLLVGATNTLVGLLWFILFQFLLEERLGYMVVLLCAHIASVLCAFVLYRRFVFRVRGHVLRDLLRFEMVNLTSLAINAVALPFLVEIFSLPVLVAQVTITAVTVLVSFFGHRGFSFRRTDRDHRVLERREKDRRDRQDGRGRQERKP